MKIPLQLFALCTVVLLGVSARALDVTITASPGESFLTNTVVTFTATATDTDTNTKYTWHFDDKSADVVLTGTNTIQHTFTVDEIFAVTVKVFNGKDPEATDFLIVEGIAPPNPNDPLGVDSNDPNLKTVINPDNGIGFTIDTSQGGFLQGTLTDGATRAAGSFESDFGDGVDSRNGNLLQHRYELAGVFIMTNVRSENGSETGKLRKTLSFNEVEIGGKFTDPNVAGLSLTERKILFKNMKGKFGFGGVPTGTTPKIRAAKVSNDKVSVSWGMTLPKGFDVASQVIDLAIGNVMESIPLSKSGKGMLDGSSAFKSVKFKMPKPDKGATFSSKPFASQVTVQMSSANLTGQGFDTEGVSNLERKTTGQKGPFTRHIQVATMFGGETYAGSAEVEMVISKDDAFGQINGRFGK